MPEQEDLKDLARNLAMSEPLMVLGNLTARGGQEIQDAYGTLKRYLSSLSGQVEQKAKEATTAVSGAASKVANAIVPKLKAEELEPQYPGWTPVAEPGISLTISKDARAPKPADIELDQIKKQYPGWTSVSDDPTGGAGTPGPDADPNTLGTFARHAGAQLNPVSAVRSAGQALMHPIDTAKQIGAAQGAVFDKAKASYEAGNYGTAARHFIDYLIPLAGPVLDTAADRAQSGHVAAGAGDAVGLGLAMFGPQALAGKGFNTPRMTNANPAEAAAVQFGQVSGVPVDAATATGNSAVRGVQWLADRSLAGSVIGGRAKQAQAAGLSRVGADLASDAHPVAVTSEQAGTNLSGALQQRVSGLERTADTAYDTVRALEGKPENAMPVPKAPSPVDTLAAGTVGQVRRIVHELDAMPYTKRLLQPAAKGSSLEHVPGTGGAGAAVFEDIVGRLESGSPTRAVVQQQLEQYLAGGKETPIVKAALDVASERGKGHGGRTVGKPELPPSAMDVPTALEGQRDTHTTMQLPVPLAEVKAALRPIHAQLARQLPLTQRQSNPGFNALTQILEGPDWAPLSQADRDLGALKQLARQHGGLAKVAVQKLGAAVNQAAADAGPDVARALSQGRAATVSKYSAQEVLEQLKAEPVQTIRALTAPKDGGIQRLRAVVREVPQMAPQIARAKLDEMLDLATKQGGFDHADRLYADWNKLGAQTKQILFPKPGQVQDLDRFFLLAKKIAENPNPSGTAPLLSTLGQIELIRYEPITAITTQFGAAGLSALLHSPTGVRLLTKGLSLTLGKAPAAARAASVNQIIATAREMGLQAVAGPGSPESPRSPVGAGAGR